jgi:predicted aminopeptidase
MAALPDSTSRGTRRLAALCARRALPCAIASALLLEAAGCLAVHYPLHAGAGQAELLLAARPLEEVLEGDRVPRAVRRLLSEVPEVKRFGEAKGLRATSSYRSYVDLHRPAVVWAVSACPELSLEAKVWRFPIAGSVPYLGWFDERAARDFASGLEADGLDVDVRPVSAYSTLGWFDDPVLSSMLAPGNEGLAWLVETVLHESVHATLYVPGQSHFNEGLASFAGRRLTKEYLAAVYGTGAAASLDETKSRPAARAKAWNDALHEAALALDALYKDPAKTDAQKRSEKKALLAALQERLQLRRPPNNAMLAQHLTYRAGAGPGGFERVLTACNGDWRCFFARLGKVRGSDFDKQQQESFEPLLERLSAQ